MKKKRSKKKISKFKENRFYALDSQKLSLLELAKKSSELIKDIGFCVIDNVVPQKKIKNIRGEILSANKKIYQNIQQIKKIIKNKKFTENALLRNRKIQLRSVGIYGRPSKPPNDIIWMPEYAKYLAHNKVVSCAKNILDDQIRIAQLHPRVISTSPFKEKEIILRNDHLGLPRIDHGPATARDWHTDWPHDPSAYGGGNPNENIGFIRRPFPDITMCLVMVWYFNDVNDQTGGTWVVPKSHKDPRTPRGPADNIVLTAPIPGEMQIKAKAGSVFVQDSRLWHSAPMHNYGDQDRVAVVNRWCPWWLSVNDYAQQSRFNVVCRPLSKKEFKFLPKKLKPLMKHLCPEENDTIQKPLLNKSNLAVKRTRWAYKLLRKKFNKLSYVNKKIKIFEKHK